MASLQPTKDCPKCGYGEGMIFCPVCHTHKAANKSSASQLTLFEPVSKPKSYWQM